MGNPTWVDGFVPPTGGSPDDPVLNDPADGASSTGIALTLDVTVSDPGSHDLDVIFYGRPYASGTFAPIATSEGVASGDHATTVWSGRDAGQTYEWYVTVNNGSQVLTGPTWTFHTDASLGDPVFVGAGDIADCSSLPHHADDTGNILNGVDGTVWTSGDNVYPAGTSGNYTGLLRLHAVGLGARALADARYPWQPRLGYRPDAAGARERDPRQLLRLLRQPVPGTARPELLQLRHPQQQLAHREPRHRVPARPGGPERRSHQRLRASAPTRSSG